MVDQFNDRQNRFMIFIPDNDKHVYHKFPHG